ncbi:RHS repeat domain-containing protein [Labilibaculum euxinus]
MRKLFSALVLCLCMYQVLGQDTGGDVPSFPELHPKSPEAYSLGRYGEVPVGTYTGKPEISIPIYNVKVRDFTLPISLTYDATGIRVDQEATLVGLGWNLMAGGIINHIINGGDDQKPNSYNKNSYLWDNWLKFVDSGEIHDQNPFDVSPSENQSEYWTKNRIENYPLGWSCMQLNPSVGGDFSDSEDNIVIQEAAQGVGQVDVYSVMLPGLSFKFVINPYTDSPEIIGKVNDKIIVSHDGVFTITDSKGIKYVFEGYERSTGLDNSESREISRYLSQIILPEGDVIVFRYQYKRIRLLPQFSEKRIYRVSSGLYDGDENEYDYDIKRYENEIPYLTEIETDKEIVKFLLEGRLDIAGEGRKLSSIEVVSKFNNRIVKKINLNHSYFEGETKGFVTNKLFNQSPLLNDNSIFTPDVIGKRLKLDNIEEVSGLESLTLYQFKYDETVQLPAKSSLDKDHWGFYNAEGNSTLIPDKTDLNYLHRGANKYGMPYDIMNSIKPYIGANRRMNPTSVKTGIIKEIVYPTKGSTIFEFESNSYSNYYTLLNTDYYPDWFASYYYDVMDRNWGGSSDVLEKSFSLENATNVTFWASISAGMLGENLYDFRGSKVELFKVTGSVETSMKSLYINPADMGNLNKTDVTINEVVPLQAGDYVLRAYMKDEYGNQETAEGGFVHGRVSFQKIKEIVMPASQKMYGGGLRVKSIVSKNEFGEIVGQTNYNYEYSDGRTSGLLMSPINYMECSYYTDKRDGLTREYKKSLITSSSAIPLSSSAGGSYVGYSRVVKTNVGEEGKMEIIYSYKNKEDCFYKSLPAFSFLSNGELEYETWLDISGKQVKFYRYNYDDKENELLWLNTFVKDHYKGPSQECSGTWGTVNFYSYVGRWEIINYPFQRVRRTLESKVVTIDDVTETTTYSYSPDNYKINQLITSQSKGGTITEKISYPSLSSSLGTQNIVSVPTGVEKFENGNKVSGWEQVLNDYGNPTAINIYDHKKKTNIQDRVIIYNPLTQNISELTKSGNEKNSVVWGYDNKLVVINAIGISESNLSSDVQVALGQLGYSNLDLLLKQVDDMTTSSQKTLWQNFYQKLKTQISESDWSFSLFTYKPIVGMTSQTDSNGITTYYEYDDFGRLKFIKDADGNILKHNVYHYQNQ